MCSTRNGGLIFYFTFFLYKQKKTHTHKIKPLAVGLISVLRISLFRLRQKQSAPGNIFPVAMLRTLSCSASLSSASLFFRFFRQFPRSYMSLSSSTATLRIPGHNLRRISSPSVAGRRLFLRRGLRIPSAAVRGVNGQFSRFSVRAVATQPAPLYPGEDFSHRIFFSLKFDYWLICS